MDPSNFENLPCSTFYGRRFVTFREAKDDIISSPHQTADIVIIPPDVDCLTDNEEIDDDNLEFSELPKDIPGQVEIYYSSDEEIPLARMRQNLLQPDKNCEYESEDEIPLASLAKRLKKEPCWTTETFDKTIPESFEYQERLESLKVEMENKTPVEIFEKLFDSSVIQHIVEQSKLYASQNNNHDFHVNEDEIRIFIGILLLSGYHRLPRERLYWCLDEDVAVPVVSNSMSRNRYYDIKKYLHFSDNLKLDKTDKMFKVRPLMDMLNKNFQQWGVFHKNLSLDEAMVKYYGHHPAKQFIRGKPVRFGYKDWMLCSDSGYCYNFDTYCGASPSLPKNRDLPLGSAVVLKLLKILETPTSHTLFFDNYFTSHALLQTLRERAFRATGTVRDNRTKKCPLMAINEVKKKPRGYFEHQYDKTNSLLFVRWKDNNVVTMATNYDSVEPLIPVKRWDSSEKAKVDVPQPFVFSNYNKSMGGVDLLDQAVNNYRISIQGKKWWWPLFTHMINLAIVNAWRISLISNNSKMDLLSFHRSITRHHLMNFTKSVYTRNRPQGSVPLSIVRSNNNHFPEKLDKRLRCRMCHLQARWKCGKCGITLCLERSCFADFHQQ